MCNHVTVFVVRVAVLKDTNNSFYAFCPGLPGIHVSGSTKKEAVDEAKASIVDVISMYSERGEEIPENEQFYILKGPKGAKELRKDDFIFPVPAHVASKLINCDSGV